MVLPNESDPIPDGPQKYHRSYQNHGGMDMVSEISTTTRTEVLEAIRGRYREASKPESTDS